MGDEMADHNTVRLGSVERCLYDDTYIVHYNDPLYRPYIDLIRETISHYVIHLRMAKAHECPLAAVYMAVGGEA